ncbi:unnamed protein product, partial [Mesorhabditis belari]|uniref:F-box domain-containing protein n=1 Tax=Mesorhabditis belari TaxID=2138241 RepID=A0AAF3EB93_9BILA
MQRKRRRRELIEQKGNSLLEEHHVSPGSDVVSKVLITNSPQFSPRSSRKHADYFPFDFLPKHVQEKILDFIPLRNRVCLERVSCTWRHILLDSWKKIKSVSIPGTLTELLQLRPISDTHVCGLLHKCGKYLTTVDLYLPQHFITAQHVLYTMSNLCMSIKSLTLRTELDEIAMTYLLKTYVDFFAQLKELEIFYNGTHSIHNGLRAISRSMHSIESFRLECYSLPLNIASLFPASNQLKRFAIRMKNRSALPSISTSASQMHGHPLILDTRVHNSFIGDFFAYLSDVYPCLEELEVSILATSITNEDRLCYHLARIGSQRRMKKLSLGLVTIGQWWGSTALRSISAFHSLRELSLTACQLPYDFAAIINIAGLGETLTSLRLSVIGHLDASRLRELFSTLPQLRHFSLNYTPEFPAPLNIDVHLFVNMFMFCYRLSYLELVECPGVDRVALVQALHSAFHDTAQYSNECLEYTVRLRMVGGSTLANRRKRGLKCCATVDLRAFVHILSMTCLGFKNPN